MKEQTAMYRLATVGLLCGFTALLGCGGSDRAGGNLVPVAGTVTVDGETVSNVVLTFFPQGTTQGNGGGGATDDKGHFVAATPQGATGLPPGTYKVVASRRLNPDGSLPDPKVPPIESPARETLDRKYSDVLSTELTATVTAGENKAFDFVLQSAPRK